ncbi:MAG TPA: PQQ-binding-like beta-propeller repeat protein, partial [Ktedonobacterales bacterium]
MAAPAIVVLGVLLGLLVAAGIMVALVRGGRERRKPLLAALIVVLVLTAVGGVAWVRAGRGSPAPVDASLTLFTQGRDCSRVTGDCAQTNALYAVRAKSGSVRWEVVEPEPAYFIGSAPLFHDGVVYAYTSAGPADAIGSTVPYLLTAWRGRDGAPLWHTRILTPCCGAPLTYVADGQLVVLTYDAVGSDGHLTWGLMRLRASDGAMLGMISLPARGEVPVIVDNMVYQCQHSGTIMALRLSDGALVWRSSAYESTYTDCALKEADGVVFASILALKSDGTAAGEAGQLLALNATNGQMLWRYTT